MWRWPVFWEAFRVLPMGFGKSLILSTVCFWEEQYYTHNYHRAHDIQTFCPIEFQGLLYSVNCSLKIKAHILLLSKALGFVGFPPSPRGKHRLHWCFNNSSNFWPFGKLLHVYFPEDIFLNTKNAIHKNNPCTWRHYLAKSITDCKNSTTLYNNMTL